MTRIVLLLVVVLALTATEARAERASVATVKTVASAGKWIGEVAVAHGKLAVKGTGEMSKLSWRGLKWLGRHA